MLDAVLLEWPCVVYLIVFPFHAAVDLVCCSFLQTIWFVDIYQVKFVLHSLLLYMQLKVNMCFSWRTIMGAKAWSRVRDSLTAVDAGGRHR